MAQRAWGLVTAIVDGHGHGGSQIGGILDSGPTARKAHAAVLATTTRLGAFGCRALDDLSLWSCPVDPWCAVALPVLTARPTELHQSNLQSELGSPATHTLQP